MRLKVLIPVAVFFAAALTAMIWFGSQREKTIQLSNAKDGSIRNMAILSEAVQSEIEQARTTVSKVVGLSEANQMAAAEKSLSSFVAIGAVKADGTDFKWRVQSTKNKFLKTNELDLIWLKEAKNFEGNSNEVRVIALKDLQGELRSGIIFKMEVQSNSGQREVLKVVALSMKPFLQNLVDRISNEKLQFFLATEDGVAVGHPQLEYVGNSLAGSSWISKVKVVSGVSSDVSKDARGTDVISVFEKISGTNIVTVAQSQTVGESFFSVWGKVLLLITMIGFICLAYLSFTVDDVLADQDGHVEEKVIERVIEKVVEKVVEKPLNPQAASDELQESIRKILLHLKGPIVSILGHIQLAKGQGGIKNLTAIEDETRQIREWLDRLNEYASSPTQSEFYQTYFLHEVVDAALKVMEGSLIKNGVKLGRNIPTDLKIKVQPDELKFVIINLIKNSLEAMHKVYKKDLLLEAKKQNGQIVFEVSDSGEGIPDENVHKVFLPFYSTRSSVDHKGLGLASAQGIIRKFSGKMKVDPSPFFGAKFVVEIPESKDAAISMNSVVGVQRAPQEPKGKPLLPVNGPSEISSGAALLKSLDQAAEISKTPAKIESVVPEKSISQSGLKNIEFVESKPALPKTSEVETIDDEIEEFVSVDMKSDRQKTAWQEESLGDKPAILGPKIETPNIKIEAPGLNGNRLKKREIEGPTPVALIRPKERQ